MTPIVSTIIVAIFALAAKWPELLGCPWTAGTVFASMALWETLRAVVPPIWRWLKEQ